MSSKGQQRGQPPKGNTKALDEVIGECHSSSTRTHYRVILSKVDLIEHHLQWNLYSDHLCRAYWQYYLLLCSVGMLITANVELKTVIPGRASVGAPFQLQEDITTLPGPIHAIGWIQAPSKNTRSAGDTIYPKQESKTIEASLLQLEAHAVRITGISALFAESQCSYLPYRATQ